MKVLGSSGEYKERGGAMANQKGGFRFIRGQGMRCAVGLAKNGGRKMKTEDRCVFRLSLSILPSAYDAHACLSAFISGYCFPAVIFCPPSFAIRISTEALLDLCRLRKRFDIYHEAFHLIDKSSRKTDFQSVAVTDDGLGSPSYGQRVKSKDRTIARLSLSRSRRFGSLFP